MQMQANRHQCLECGNGFLSRYRTGAFFCSVRCRVANHRRRKKGERMMQSLIEEGWTPCTPGSLEKMLR